MPTNLGVCKPTFYTFYTSHLRWNSTIYHTDLGQNAVFHNFSRQINFFWHSVNIQDDQLWAFSETIEKILKITNTASQFSLLTSTKFALNINRVTLQHNKEFICLFFLFKGFITMCNLKKHLMHSAFWVNSCKQCSWTTENKQHSD